MRCAVVGAGGMIGGELVGRLLADGHDVRAVDVKPRSQWWQTHPGAHNLPLVDCRTERGAEWAVDGAQWVFDLAENMGGVGFIERERVACLESVTIGLTLIRAAARGGVERFFFSSSACVYNVDHQRTVDARGLREDEAWPARPDAAYGLSKLYMEEVCRFYRLERGLDTRVARYHNVYGAPCSWNDGREKAPAAICRKVAEAVKAGADSIEVWGDGSQTRSFCFLADAVDATVRLMASSYAEPLNVGSDRLVSVNELVDLVQEAAGTSLRRVHVLDAPQGVRGRNADLSMIREVLGWEPTTSLEDGLAATYAWVAEQVGL